MYVYRYDLTKKYIVHVQPFYPFFTHPWSWKAWLRQTEWPNYPWTAARSVAQKQEEGVEKKLAVSVLYVS